jgi:hypothetical protein
MSMSDPTEAIRRERLAEINAEPGSREALEAEYGQVWDTEQLTGEFEVIGFMAPLVVVRRRSDGVKGSAEVVQVLHEGQVIVEHPRHSRQRLLLDPAHYDGPGDDRVAPPTPLGKLGRRLQEIVAQPVEQRPWTCMPSWRRWPDDYHPDDGAGEGEQRSPPPGSGRHAREAGTVGPGPCGPSPGRGVVRSGQA